MVTAKIATLTHGGDRGNQYVGGKRPIGPLPQSDAAKLLNVGETRVKRASRVRDVGIKELQQAVESGDVSLWSADQIAALPFAITSYRLSLALAWRLAKANANPHAVGGIYEGDAGTLACGPQL
jgi:hypothetical protein